MNSGALQPIMDWAGEVFFEDVTSTVTYSGYHSQAMRDSRDNYQVTEMPFDVTVTTQTQRLKPSAVLASVLVVLVFVTIATTLRSLFRR